MPTKTSLVIIICLVLSGIIAHAQTNPKALRWGTLQKEIAVLTAESADLRLLQNRLEESCEIDVTKLLPRLNESIALTLAINSGVPNFNPAYATQFQRQQIANIERRCK